MLQLFSNQNNAQKYRRSLSSTQHMLATLAARPVDPNFLVHIKIKSVLDSKAQANKDFNQAKQGDVFSNFRLGNRFKTGEAGFPLDLIQAKKYYLLAALLTTDNIDARLIQAHLLAINEGVEFSTALQQTGFTKTACQAADIKTKEPSLPYSRASLRQQLAEIEHQHGLHSDIETAACTPFSLKQSCIIKITENEEAFDLTGVPELIQDDISAFKNKPTWR